MTQLPTAYVEAIAAPPKRAVPSPFPGWVHIASVAVLVALVIILPFLVSDAWLGILAMAGVYAIATIGVTLFSGRMGQFSMAMPAFMGVGAYGMALMGAQLGWSFGVVIVVALALGLVLGFLAGLVAIRLGGDELAITTLGILMVGSYIWASWTEVTGGDSGTSVRAAPTTILGIDITALPGLTREQSIFIVVWLVVAVVAWFGSSITGFRPGRAMQAIHDSQRTAEAVGVDVRAYKVKVSAIMGMCGTLAGVLYATVQQFVAPSGFGISAAIMLFAMMLVGGQGRIAGAILGALIVWIFRSWIATDTAFFGFILKTSDASPGLITPGALNMLVYGLLIVLVLMFAPRGLLSLWDRFARSVGRRLFP